MKIKRGTFTSDKIYLTTDEIRSLSHGSTILGSGISIQPSLSVHEKLDKYRDSYMDKTGQTPTVAFIPNNDYVEMVNFVGDKVCVYRPHRHCPITYHGMLLRSWDNSNYALGEVMERLHKTDVNFSVPMGSANTIGSSRTDIIDSIKSAQELLKHCPKIIEVWKGDDNIVPLQRVPSIREDSHLDSEACYIVAGIGVIAGNKAFERLKKQNYITVWVDEPVVKY